MVRAARRVLVAGGAGFVGSHLCTMLIDDGVAVTCIDNLQSGVRANLVEILDHPRFDLVEGDIADALPASVSNGSFDDIYNLTCAAAPPADRRDPEHMMMTCVVGTRQLLRLAERNGARFLLTTGEIRGDPTGRFPAERDRVGTRPVRLYACRDEGQRAAETLAFDFDRTARAEIRVARIFDTYGPRLDPRGGGVVADMILRALGGRALTVHGAGEQPRSFCFVDDVVRGLLGLMRHDGPQPGPVDLGGANEITMGELGRRIALVTGCDPAVVHLPLPIDAQERRRPDTGRARELLGWEPTTALDAGLEATIAWFTAAERSGATNMLAGPRAMTLVH